MPTNTEELCREWFIKAQDDELSAKAILRGRDGAPSTVCFLSQQIAEKYLKGLLIFHGGTFPKIHDLLELKELLLEKGADINQLHKEAKTLNRYYIDARYPGDYPEFSWQDAEEAFEAAKKIRDFVLKKTGE